MAAENPVVFAEIGNPKRVTQLTENTSTTNAYFLTEKAGEPEAKKTAYVTVENAVKAKVQSEFLRALSPTPSDTKTMSEKLEVAEFEKRDDVIKTKANQADLNASNAKIVQLEKNKKNGDLFVYTNNMPNGWTSFILAVEINGDWRKESLFLKQITYNGEDADGNRTYLIFISSSQSENVYIANYKTKDISGVSKIALTKNHSSAKCDISIVLDFSKFIQIPNTSVSIQTRGFLNVTETTDAQFVALEKIKVLNKDVHGAYTYSEVDGHIYALTTNAGVAIIGKTGNIVKNDSYITRVFVVKGLDSVKMQMVNSTSGVGYSFFDDSDSFVSGNSYTSGTQHSIIDVIIPQNASTIVISNFTDEYADVSGFQRFLGYISATTPLSIFTQDTRSSFSKVDNELYNISDIIPSNRYTNIVLADDCTGGYQLPISAPFDGIPKEGKGIVSGFMYVGNLRVEDIVEFIGWKTGWQRPIYYYDKEKNPILIGDSCDFWGGGDGVVSKKAIRKTNDVYYIRTNLQTGSANDRTDPNDCVITKKIDLVNQDYVFNDVFSKINRGINHKHVRYNREVYTPDVEKNTPYTEKHTKYYEYLDAITCVKSHTITKKLIGKDALNNNIYSYDLKVNQESNNMPQKKALLVGCVHGSEVMSAKALCCFFNLASTSNNAFWSKIRSTYRLIIIPCANPSGIDALTRSNHNGVNINRNFPFGWVVSGNAPSPFGDYEGTAPASELETKAVMSVIDSFYFDVIIDTHAFDSMGKDYTVFWTTNRINNSFNEDLSYLATALDSEIKNIYTEYATSTILGLINPQDPDSINGTLESYAYSEIGVNGKYAATVEVSSKIGSDNTTLGNPTVYNANLIAYSNVVNHYLMSFLSNE